MSDGRRESHEGTVFASLPNGLVRVELDNGRKVVAHVGRRTRMVVGRVIEGDRVNVELSPFDPSQGRIVSTIA